MSKDKNIKKLLEDLDTSEKQIKREQPTVQTTDGRTRSGRKPDFDKSIPLIKSTYKIPVETKDRMLKALVTTHKDEKSINTFLDKAINYYIDQTANDKTGT